MNFTCRCGVEPLFDLGQVSISPQANEMIQEAGLQVIQLLWLHVTGQWGTDDFSRNQEAVRTGRLVLSQFSFGYGKDVVAATDADRTTTIVELREEFEH